MKPEDVTLEQMIEYGELCIGTGAPQDERTWAIQRAIVDQLKKLKRGLRALSKDLSPAPAFNEDEIGKLIQEKVNTQQELDRLTGSPYPSDTKQAEERQSHIDWLKMQMTLINSRLRGLKEQQMKTMQHRLTTIDVELGTISLDHVSEADLRTLRARVVHKIEVIQNELQAL